MAQKEGVELKYDPRKTTAKCENCQECQVCYTAQKVSKCERCVTCEVCYTAQN